MQHPAPPDHDPFAGLAIAAGELKELAASVGLADEVGPATVAIARRLARVPVGDPGPLASLLFVLADTDLRLLAHVCGGEPLRACAAALAWMKHILPLYGARPPPAPAPPPLAPSPTPRDAQPPLEDLRAQLAVLIQRRLPPGFPPPVAPSTRTHNPLDLGMAIHHQLDLHGAAAAAGDAAMACNEAIQALCELLPGLGWDYSVGELRDTLRLDLAGLAELMERLPELRRIVDELGRIEATQHTRRRSDGGGRESVVGARIGGELSDVLPCELGLLATPDTEDLFYQRMTEHRLLSLELVGVTLETTRVAAHRGPAIACIDTSGSMQGAPEAVAKAIVLAAARRLARERRPLYLILFGGPGAASELEILPGRPGIQGLLAFLRMGFHAGTDYDTPLRRALELLRTPTFARADVLIVTDGLCRASARVTHEVAEAKQSAKARVLGVVIGLETAGLEDFADQLWRIDPSSPRAGGIDLRIFTRE